MSRPTIYPDFALTDVNDATSGQPNVSEPSQSLKDTGWIRRQKPYRQHLNWLHRTTNEWIKWIDSLFDDGITNSAVIFNQSLKTTDSPSFSGLTLIGDILPEMTGATGIVSVRSIGSSTKYLKAVYADEVFVGASSLYVNGKKVIEDLSDEINISTDSDQGLRLKTTGSGIINLDSEDEIDSIAQGGFDFSVPVTNPSKHFSVTNDSTNGNISLSASVVSGQIQLLASEIDLTSALIDINGDVNISGTLTMGATTLTNLLSSISSTTSNVWGLDNDSAAYPILKNDNGVLRIRNKDDNDDADLIVKNLTVNGTTTTINSETVLIADNIMVLNSDVTDTPTQNAGIEVERGTDTNASLIWDEGSNVWKAGLAGAEVELLDINHAGNWLLDSTNLYYNAGNVGIGTNNPLELLVVHSGNIFLDYDFSLKLGSNNNFIKRASSGTEQMIFADAGSINLIIDSDNNATTSAFTVRNNGTTVAGSTELFRVQENGNVGIGTNNPLFNLDVNGYINLTNALIFNNSLKHKTYLNVANYFPTGTVSVAGTMKITLPKTWSSTIISLKIIGNDYGTGDWSCTIYGYNYIVASAWLNANCTISGKPPFKSVRLGHDGTNCCILLGSYTDTNWNFTTINVDLIASYQNISDWQSGWTIERITDETGITISQTPTIKNTGTDNYLTKYLDGSRSLICDSIIYDNGTNIGISTSSPLGKLDVSSGGIAMVLGANSSSVTRSDTTTKLARIGAAHYTNAEEPISIIYTSIEAENNYLMIGGGTGLLNAATEIRFYTAANSTTLTGTQRMAIKSDGTIATFGNYINNNGTANNGLRFDTTNKAIITASATITGTNRSLIQLNDDTALKVGNGGGLTLRGNDGVIIRDYAGINAYKSNDISGNYSGQLHFQTRLNGANLATRMIIDENGNIGIGTTTPSSLTHFYGGGGATGSLITESSNTTGYIGNKLLKGTDSFWLAIDSGTTTAFNCGVLNGGVLWRSGTNPISIVTNSIERLRVGADGMIATFGNYINNGGTANSGLRFDSTNITYIKSSASTYGDISRVISIEDDTAMGTGVGGAISFGGKYTTTNSFTYFAGIKSYKANATDGNYSGQLHFQTRLNGSLPATRMIIDENGGVTIGSPTGSFKGAGTLNAVAVYDDNVLLTGYVLDKYVSQDSFDISVWDKQSKGGLVHVPARKFLERSELMFSIDRYSKFFLDNKYLPTFEDIETSKEVGSTGTMIQKLWETVEIQAVHIYQLNENNKKLVNRIEFLESKI